MENLYDLDKTVPKALVEAGITDENANIYIDGTLHYLPGNKSFYNVFRFKVYGRGEDAGAAIIHNGIDGTEIFVSVDDESGRTEEQIRCTTFNEVVKAIKRLIPIEDLDPNFVAVPF